MGTPLGKVFEAFLTRISSDDWSLPEELDLAERDWRSLLEIAIFRFRYPRIPLEFAEDGKHFTETLGRPEIQVLATYMKHEWVKRCIATWDELRMLYSSKDFSAANHLDKLLKTSEQLDLECIKAAATYSRSIDRSPFDFGKLAGRQNK